MNNLLRQVTVGDRLIGLGSPVYIVAEAGVAHFGEMDNALKMIDIAADASADAIKFQIYNTEKLIVKSEKEWRERLGSKELKYDDFFHLKEYAAKRRINFFCTPHEEDALEFAVKKLELNLLKIGSGEVGNVPFLKSAAGKMLPTIVSLGLHGEKEIDKVVRIFQEEGNDNLMLMHCVTRYPAPPEDTNLKTISWLQKKYSCPIGYSDHTAGHTVSMAAVAIGASLIEKHFFIDSGVEGSQDALSACDANDLGEFVASIRAVEAALGVEGPNPSTGRFENLSWARKSLVISHPLTKGHRLTKKDLLAKRPGKGISPEELSGVLGKTLMGDVKKDHILSWNDLK